MKAFAYPFRAAATIAALVLLTGCQTGARTDTSGRVMSVSEWKAAPAQESYLDIPERLPGIDVKLEKQLRDNSIYQNRLVLDGGKGTIFVQSIVTGGWYSYSAKKKIDDRETFVVAAKGMAPARLPASAQPTKIRHSSKRAGGWYAVFPGKTEETKCIVARGGYVFRENKYDNDDGTNYDSSVSASYCGAPDSVAEIESMLGTTVPRR